VLGGGGPWGGKHIIISEANARSKSAWRWVCKMGLLGHVGSPCIITSDCMQFVSITSRGEHVHGLMDDTQFYSATVQLSSDQSYINESVNCGDYILGLVQFGVSITTIKSIHY